MRFEPGQRHWVDGNCIVSLFSCFTQPRLPYPSRNVRPGTKITLKTFVGLASVDQTQFKSAVHVSKWSKSNTYAVWNSAFWSITCREMFRMSIVARFEIEFQIMLVSVQNSVSANLRDAVPLASINSSQYWSMGGGQRGQWVGLYSQTTNWSPKATKLTVTASWNISHWTWIVELRRSLLLRTRLLFVSVNTYILGGYV